MGNSINFGYNFNNFNRKIFSVLSKKYGRSFYNTSFNEGVNTNTLEIVAKNKIELIEKNDYLISSFNDIDDKKIIYRLNFENKKELQLFKETIEKSDQIEKDKHYLQLKW